MQYRTLGKSGLSVPVVSFGAWAVGGWMWGGADDAASIRALQKGIDLGMTCIDTAPAYGFGHSERIVGRAIAGRREGLVIASKCCLRWDCTDGEFFFESLDSEGRPRKLYRNLRPESIRYECEQSLERLGVDVIDLYQCHWPDTTTPLEATMDALLGLQQQGKIRAIGVSNFTPDMMRTCLSWGHLASNQPKYNALERGAEKDVLPFCRENNIGVLAYSPIAQGMLTGKVSVDRVFPEGDVRRGKPLYKPENRRRVLDMLTKVQPIADGHGVTLGQMFIAWTIAQPGLTSALVGARSEEQVTENARAGEVKLSDEELAIIRREVEALGELG
jgi:aryl-alcohol dehydrogenase-like predicted oxidoreductase